MWSSSSWGGELPTSFNDVDTTPKSRCTSAASARRASGDIIPLRICPHRGCGFPRATDTRQSAGGGCGPLPKEEEYDWTGHKKNPQDIDLADSAHWNRGLRRRGRDSNPRYSCPYTAFRVRPDRPLRHLSFFIRAPAGETVRSGNSSETSTRLVSECKYRNYFFTSAHSGQKFCPERHFFSETANYTYLWEGLQNPARDRVARSGGTKRPPDTKKGTVFVIRMRKIYKSSVR